MAAGLTDFDGDAAIVDASTFLGNMGLFGTIWLDRDLIVRRTFGDIADFVTVGEIVSARWHGRAWNGRRPRERAGCAMACRFCPPARARRG